MNREILFRGKRKDNNEWVYGQIVYDKDKIPFIVEEVERYNCDENDDLYAINWYEVITETVGQYTGLKDKNGKKTFEGDIAYYNDFTSSFKFDITGKIVFTSNCIFEIEYYDGTLKQKRTRPLVCNEHPIFTAKKTEVIGNPFDNPELLDKEVK